VRFIYNRRDKLILSFLIRQFDGKRRFSHASSITERTWHALEKGQPLTIYDIQSLPFCEEQSQHWSFPGNRITHRMTACCSSTRLGLPLPASALPLASNARSRARSLQFTRTDIHARWSASSSAWKWYVLLSEIETMTVLRGVRRIVKKRRERSRLSIKRNTYNWWDRSLVCRPAPIWSDRSIDSPWWAVCSHPRDRYRGIPPLAQRTASSARLASFCLRSFSAGGRNAWHRVACHLAADAASNQRLRSRLTVRYIINVV